MTEETYTRRSESPYIIKTVKRGADWLDITTHVGTCFGVRVTELTRTLEAGDAIILETIRFSTITGLRYDTDTETDAWLFRKSDQELEEEHRKFVADMNARHVKELEENREDYTRREALLIPEMKQRIQRFRDASADFELDGWGYELIICELVPLYVASAGEDDEVVMEFSNKHGTSGNQHECAKFIANHMDRVPEIPAGLAPLTGSADYSRKEDTNG